MKKFISAILCLVMLAAICTGCGGDQASSESGAADTDASEDVKVIKLGHGYSETSPVHLSAQLFADTIEERTDGRIQIEIHSNSSLGDERQLIEGTQMGSIDMCYTAATPVGGFVPELMVVDLPFLIQDFDHADKVYMGEIGDELLGVVDDYGMKALTFFDIGFRVLNTNNRAINSIDDLKGLKVRTMENELHLEAWRAMGADPLPMAWTEAYTAMQQGAIDAIECTYIHDTTLAVIEIEKYCAETRHVYTPGIQLVSSWVWNSLSAEDQVLFEECAVEAALYNNELNRELDSESKQVLLDAGIEITYPDIEAFREATQVVYDNHPEYADMVAKIRAAE